MEVRVMYRCKDERRERGKRRFEKGGGGWEGRERKEKERIDRKKKEEMKTYNK